MSDIKDQPNPSSYFTLYDVLSPAPPETALASFDALTGGDQTISLVTYKVIDPNGSVTTRFMPGQTSFDPVALLRPMDFSSSLLYKMLYAGILGKLQRKNYSVSMFDGTGTILAWWNLYNALPSKLDGFSFNEHTESNYTDFEIYFQAESIDLHFPPD
jgi:phage tail-like protein